MVDSSNSKTILCINAADTAGGTGITTDARVAQAEKLDSIHVYTGISVQYQDELMDIIEIPTDVLHLQLQSIMKYKRYDAIKIGVVPNARAAEEIGNFIQQVKVPVVLDISLYNRSGVQWSSQDVILSVIEHIIPYITIFTPNKQEAEQFSGMPIDTIEDAQVAVQRLAQLNYDMYVLLKGRLFSHTYRADEYGDKWCSDILYYKNDFYLFEAPTISNTMHLGSGDAYSTLIACQLAKNQNMIDAVRTAKEKISYAIKASVHHRITINSEGKTDCISSN
ncbi:MAG: hydroxymethylpyrimidine/phosphomethylpyrimidine kinase [Bacteroidia bacterium]|nr:hydroxymethylpyrimidine/phosphomethylpyrimidine kinase [Bacteroidia bacterium]MDW8347204.1 PfkB family carbohydrate kinase [Bacteroidia bacterium]